MSSNKTIDTSDIVGLLGDVEGTTKAVQMEPPKELSEGTPKDPSKEHSEGTPKDNSEKKKSGRAPKVVKDLEAETEKSPIHGPIVELIKKINQKIAESRITRKRIPIPEPKVYKFKDSFYTTLTKNKKDGLMKKVATIKEAVKNNTEIKDLVDELDEKIDGYEVDSEVVNKLQEAIGGGKIIIYKEVKPKMTVQNYIDELAQLDAFTVPEEKLRQGLINAIDKKIIGLDKSKIDSTIDAIYSRSLLFNKKLKKILEDTPEEELVEKIPPDVLKRFNKIRDEKQDTKNRKYKLFKKPPPREPVDHTYGLNPLLLRGARVLTNQFI